VKNHCEVSLAQRRSLISSSVTNSTNLVTQHARILKAINTCISPFNFALQTWAEQIGHTCEHPNTSATACTHVMYLHITVMIINMTSRKKCISQKLKCWFVYGFSYRQEMKGPFSEKQWKKRRRNGGRQHAFRYSRIQS
jgi:hypothetical protein